jgi:hypothetical protein
MSEDEQRQHLHLIDTSESLTLDELRELKKIAQMSRTAKAFLAVTIALVTLFGIDKVIELIKH